MSQIFALIVAASGVALLSAGPDCGSSKTDSLAGNATGSACCELGGCSGCDHEAAPTTAPASGSMLQTVSMTTPSADLYETAAWPSKNAESDLYAKDLQGQKLPVALGNESWITERVETEGKVVVLDFWATWCPPCIAASPILDKLQTENSDNLAVLAISGLRDPESDVRKFVEKHEVAYAHLYDADLSAYKPFESQGIPLIVVLSTDGVIRWMGNPHEKDFVPAVEQIIAADPAVQERASAQANATVGG